jgi:predicted nucleic acid-binding protein
MSDDFIDTGVFVYLIDDSGDSRKTVAEGLVFAALSGKSSACISFQVVQETLNVFTRLAQPPVTPDDARRFLEQVLEPLWTVMPSTALYQRALSVHARFRYHFYDALIIAAALEAGCRRLLSEDMQAGQAIDSLTIENPFAGVIGGA